MSASAPARRAVSRLPPREVVELARHLVAGPDGQARPLVHERLKTSKPVYRLRFEVLAGAASVW